MLVVKQLGVLQAAGEHRRRLPVILGRAEDQDGVGSFDGAGVVGVGRAPHGHERGDQHRHEHNREERDNGEEGVAADRAHGPNLATPPGGALLAPRDQITPDASRALMNPSLVNPFPIKACAPQSPPVSHAITHV